MKQNRLLILFLFKLFPIKSIGIELRGNDTTMGFDKALLDHDFCKSILYFIPFRTVLYIGYVDFSSFVEIMRSKLPNNDEMGLFY